MELIGSFAVTWTSAVHLVIGTGALTVLTASVRRIEMLVPSGACSWRRRCVCVDWGVCRIQMCMHDGCTCVCV